MALRLGVAVILTKLFAIEARCPWQGGGARTLPAGSHVPKCPGERWIPTARSRLAGDVFHKRAACGGGSGGGSGGGRAAAQALLDLRLLGAQAGDA